MNNLLDRRKWVLVALLVFSNLQMVTGQVPFTERKDPENPKRTIIEYKPIIKKAAPVIVTRNVMDDPKFKKAPVAFQKFEMIHPVTKKPLDPNAKLTIKIPGQKDRVTTVKAYFDELNKFEKAMAERGQTIKNPAAFRDIRPQFSRIKYTRRPVLRKGFVTQSFRAADAPSRRIGGQTMTIGTANNGLSKSNSNHLTASQYLEIQKRNLTTWNAKLYISKRFENHGQPEFPAEWVTVGHAGRNIYPLIVQVPKGTEGNITRIDWQVSSQPFDGTLKEVNSPAVKLSGSVTSVAWADHFRGVTSLPNFDKYKYASFDIFFDKKKLFATPIKMPVMSFYIRAICYDKAGQIVKMTAPVRALFGEDQQKAVVVGDGNVYNSVPGFSYSFPDASLDLPFGVHVKGSGFKFKKAKKYKDAYDGAGFITGLKLTANAEFGVRHFNFMSIIDPNEPFSKPQNVLGFDFQAAVGIGTGENGGNDPQGVILNWTVLDEAMPAYEFVAAGGGSNIISLEKEFVRPLGIEFLNTTITIGPIPVHVEVKMTGEGGVKFFGQINTDNFEITGGVSPFLNTRFEAFANMNAILAYATLNADINPLFHVDMPLTINSSSFNSLALSTNLSGLKGRIYFAVGFFYPCPDLGKVIGFITGDEDMPLCECRWEYTIYDFAGFEHTYNY